MVGRGELYTRQPHARDTHAQTHVAGRREGVTHLPLGVTVYPLLHIHILIKNPSTPVKRKWIPSLT